MQSNSDNSKFILGALKAIISGLLVALGLVFGFLIYTASSTAPCIALASTALMFNPIIPIVIFAGVVLFIATIACILPFMGSSNLGYSSYNPRSTIVYSSAPSYPVYPSRSHCHGHFYNSNPVHTHVNYSSNPGPVHTHPTNPINSGNMHQHK